MQLLIMAMEPLEFFKLITGLTAPSSILISLLFIALGMVSITKGGDLFTDSAVEIARLTRVPPVIIGATIVSMSTTFPELMVSVTSTVSGKGDLAVGNALGSCLCNIGLIIGSCALLNGFLARKRNTERCIPVSRFTIVGPGFFMLLSGVIVWLFSLFSSGGAVNQNGLPAEFAIARWQAGILLCILAGYILFTLRVALSSRHDFGLDQEQPPQVENLKRYYSKLAFAFFIGACLVILGSKLLVTNAVQVARYFEVSELLIGLTILAVGTSLPEFTISILSIVKGHGALGTGNIIGANVLNITMVIATCALIHPLPIPKQTVYFDAPVVILLILAMLGLSWRRKEISPVSGSILLTIYVGYLLIATFWFAS
ncbi:MAG: calcium/sodium antiporter [Planctomycetes bacterium]|nr:calcium/sodium antiporter [Planctomycetota bacterium]MCH9726436.1 calcium/sodium antiporter [Planctomycetota bacterium]MCH9778245.1 calcium/sodium antiporter [Planctomycetota bacterium]MDF1745752.1 calcium/sodium antiporter [Gimesia sp.]